MDVDREAGGGTGSARRRRERRLRADLKHARMSVAMALAESQHHSAHRPKMAREVEWGSEQCYTTTIWSTPTPQPELFELSFDEEPCGVRPDRLFVVRRRKRFCGVQWSRSSTQCRWSRCSTALGRRWWNSWWTSSLLSISRFASRQLKCPRSSSRTSLRDSRVANRGWLAEVPTILYFLKQTVDILQFPVLVCVVVEIFKVFTPEQDSTALTVEQIVNTPVSLEGFRPGQGSASTSFSHSSAGVLDDADEPFEGFFSHFSPA